MDEADKWDCEPTRRVSTRQNVFQITTYLENGLALETFTMDIHGGEFELNLPPEVKRIKVKLMERDRD